MRGVVLPAALLCGALGLMLAFADRRGWLPSFILLCITAAAASCITTQPSITEVAFGGCWISVILLAACVHLPRGFRPLLAMSAAVDAGFWTGLIISAQGSRTDLMRALPAVLIFVPAIVCVRQGWQIAVKVVSSWLIAVSLLAALLPATSTPGYVPDHMD